MENTSEIELQKAAQKVMSDPARVFTTSDGKRLQILGAGRLNVHEGPDFLDMAVLLNGEIVIGNGEFHRKSSDWREHNHSADPRFKNLLLHIVLDDNSIEKYGEETLILLEADVEKFLKEKTTLPADACSLEDLQHYALLRLLRKTAEAQVLLREDEVREATVETVKKFLNHYATRKRRPNYSLENFEGILEALPNSAIMRFLKGVANGAETDVPASLNEMTKQKIAGEGVHLRREIMLNAIIPMALALAEEETRIALFAWFWSTPALHTYGILKRKFPNMPQEFLWQQQGMLEYMREHGRKSNVVRETLKTFGFAGMLDFYRESAV
ncbi:MAG TPA: DUF2851 family protein [Patescibacteria group bacterium]|nr:DUF2851 family protein [Patescibacteria group bacterium]